MPSCKPTGHPKPFISKPEGKAGKLLFQSHLGEKICCTILDREIRIIQGCVSVHSAHLVLTSYAGSKVLHCSLFQCHIAEKAQAALARRALRFQADLHAFPDRETEKPYHVEALTVQGIVNAENVPDTHNPEPNSILIDVA